MSKVTKDKLMILVRYVWEDEDGEEPDEFMWLHADVIGTSRGRPRREYDTFVDMRMAYDWMKDPSFKGNRIKAMDMANRLMKIVRVGKKLIEEGWRPEIVFVRDVTRRTITPLDPSNAMVVLAVAAMD